MRNRLLSLAFAVPFLLAGAQPAAAAPEVPSAPGTHAAAVRTGFAPPSRSGPPKVLPPGYPFRNLQLNLCNSGVAGCYENGQSIPEGQRVIAAHAPDVVTVNEVCLPDVRDHLFPTLTETWPADWTFWAFMPAWNKSQDAPYQCANGRGQYGNAVMGHVAAAGWAGVETVGGIYSSQDAGANESRSWVCANAVGNYFGCGTHLASGNATAADRQCDELLGAIVPGFWSSAGGYRPTVVGGDFNLRYGGRPNIQDCVPSGWYRKGDGDVQHWFITSELAFSSSREIGMSHTDHPGWLVTTTVS